MIDTAQAYHNEEGVGNTIRKSDIDCKEIFLVSKIWISNYGYKKWKPLSTKVWTAYKPTTLT